MNQIIVPAGYMGSGSTAVTNLISEFEGYHINYGDFEYVFLHCPNGLFDLEDKLLRGNNALRSDEAIHSFLTVMHRLHYNRNYWYTNYRMRASERFYPLCRQLIDDLNPIALSGTHWYYQENIEDFPKRVAWNINFRLTKLLHRPFPPNRPTTPLNYSDVQMAFPTPETFYAAARKFLGAFFEDRGLESHHLVLDQLLLPHNLWRIDNYFDDNLRVFVVERDPRDVFVLNKYIWSIDRQFVPLPFDAEDFCTCYAAMRENERPVDDPRILRLRFEDLIYRYDETCRKIYDFLGVSEEQHRARKKTVFNPAVSINNTRLFERSDYPAEETRIIEQRLGKYLYDFPTDLPLPEMQGKPF